MTNQLTELARCYRSPIYFVEQCQIYDATQREWIPFELWPQQRAVLTAMHNNNNTVALKARQLGLSWLVLAYGLWMMIFRPMATVLIFSKRDDEAVYLLDKRLKQMFDQLPAGLRYGLEKVTNSAHQLELSNGSVARAFPTSGGDSYTASLVMLDEFDLVVDQDNLLASVKPTISGGGKLIMVSRPDKSRPNSPFKKIYKAAKMGQNNYYPVFLPWHVRPTRTAAWYEAQKADIFSRTGSLDELHEQYPATDLEALAARSLDKRIPAAWLQECYVKAEPLSNPLGIPGLVIYRLPEQGHGYVLGADVAEGNPTSDESAFCVLDADNGEECATFANRTQPDTFASYIDQAGRFFNNADVLIERNNHGHAVLLWLSDNSELELMQGLDGKRGWLSNSLGKSTMYTTMAESCRDGEVAIHAFETYYQLSSIEGATLRAPAGEMDDRADAAAIASVARVHYDRLMPPKRKATPLVAGISMTKASNWRTQHGSR